MCAPGFMDDYATVGGKWQRADPVEGRVGSPFSDPGTSSASAHESAAVYGGSQFAPGDVYEGDLYQDDFYGEEEVYESESMNLDESGHGIELVPQYEDGSIILSEDW